MSSLQNRVPSTNASRSKLGFAAFFAVTLLALSTQPGDGADDAKTKPAQGPHAEPPIQLTIAIDGVTQDIAIGQRVFDFGVMARFAETGLVEPVHRFLGAKAATIGTPCKRIRGKKAMRTIAIQKVGRSLSSA